MPGPQGRVCSATCPWWLESSRDISVYCPDDIFYTRRGCVEILSRPSWAISIIPRWSPSSAASRTSVCSNEANQIKHMLRLASRARAVVQINTNQTLFLLCFLPQCAILQAPSAKPSTSVQCARCTRTQSPCFSPCNLYAPFIFI